MRPQTNHIHFILTGRRPPTPPPLLRNTADLSKLSAVDWSMANPRITPGHDPVQTTHINDFLPSIFNHPFLFADYWAYTYSHPRIVQSQLSWDPEHHFEPKKDCWCFIKIWGTRDSKNMQDFYWNGGSTKYEQLCMFYYCISTHNFPAIIMSFGIN